MSAACVGPSRLSTSNERLDGYRDALKDAGVRFDRSLVRRADFREDGGYKATRALLGRRPTLPTPCSSPTT